MVPCARADCSFGYEVLEALAASLATIRALTSINFLRGQRRFCGQCCRGLDLILCVLCIPYVAFLTSRETHR